MDAEGLDQAGALVIEPAVALTAWAQPLTLATVVRLEHLDSVWRLMDGVGGLIAEAEAVILAAGQATEALARSAGAAIELLPVRGQASWTASAARPAATAWGGYVVPMRDGFLFGATHDRGDLGLEVRAADHARNLETLAAARPELANGLSPDKLSGRAATRATTTDRLPLAGAAGPQGLFLLTGFGSRGFSWAPLLAEHVAALAVGAPSPLPVDLAEVVDPARFARRAARRGRNSDEGAC